MGNAAPSSTFGLCAPFLPTSTSSLTEHFQDCSPVVAISHGKRKSCRKLHKWVREVRLTVAQHGVPRVSGGAVDKSEAAREKERKQIEQYKSLESEVAEKVCRSSDTTADPC